ncbi:hypothetical protein PFICI_02778 [Pestalotiopsis fici W106-1]|uniref:Protein kinase domain-containing protein n=1 Tax=Pestalotiopsis fici (strain W106-1 / CGMCC3.15140) TaxID=1229662 RepID=W3XF99_PESFW|nr:uncharacterized protein PFICI_02778 [Pestalotiopsis fici W106-1]ETS84753.1 hypothetical protein PFICI_02778 [Pestalotiopsis fici W106-1]
MSFPGDASSQVSEEDRKARDGDTIVREAFERHGNYKYVRNIGEGAEGAAYLIQRKSPSETEPRRVVLKVSGGLEDLAYEEWRKTNAPWIRRPDYVVEVPVDTREWLQALANSTHTAKWVHIDPEPTKFDPDLTAKNVTVAYS